MVLQSLISFRKLQTVVLNCSFDFHGFIYPQAITGSKATDGKFEKGTIHKFDTILNRTMKSTTIPLCTT
jgi:hypothetical protein